MVAGAAGSFFVSVSVKAAPPSSGSIAHEYIADIEGLTGGTMGMSSDGQSVLVYLCDGTVDHPPTFGRWLRGSLSGTSVRLTAGDVDLVARLMPEIANGSVTVGKNHYRFQAVAVAPGQPASGLFRGEATFNGVKHVAGWNFWTPPPKPKAEAPVEGRGVRLISFATGAAGERSWPRSADITPAAGNSYRPPFGSRPSTLRTGGAIVNQQTGAVLPFVAPNLATMTAEVPGLGTFPVTRCVQAKCT
jgi:hypothetical protein